MAWDSTIESRRSPRSILFGDWAVGQSLDFAKTFNAFHPRRSSPTDRLTLIEVENCKILIYLVQLNDSDSDTTNPILDQAKEIEFEDGASRVFLCHKAPHLRDTF